MAKKLAFALSAIMIIVIGYAVGKQDYTNELAVARAVVKHHKDEAKYFYDKWREEESSHFKTKIKLDRLLAK